MKYKLVCECGYETELTKVEDELMDGGRIGDELLRHQEYCEIAIKNCGKCIKEV